MSRESFWDSNDAFPVLTLTESKRAMKVRIKKLLGDKGLNGLLDDLCKFFPEAVEIVDPEGIVVYGKAGEGTSAEYSIKLDDEVIGTVRGGPQAGALASLVAYLAGREREKRSLNAETLDTYKEVSLLYNMAEGLTASMDLGEVANLVVEQARKLMHPNAISLMLLNEESTTLEIVASSEPKDDPRTVLKPGRGIAGSVLATGKAEVINDVGGDHRFIPGNSKISSMICVPLRARNQAIGVINVSSREPRQFRARDLKLLNTIASQAASAITNARLYEELRHTFAGTVRILVETMEKTDTGNRGHSRRVADYCMGIGKMMKLSTRELIDLKLAALLHDIGKIGLQTDVPPQYRNELIVRHTRRGAEVLQHITQLKNVVPGVLHHHEHQDGTGLPDCLKGDSIPLLARIIAVADAFDRMVTGRTTAKRMSLDDAIGELMIRTGSLYDLAVVNAFIKACQEIKGLVHAHI